MREHELKDCFAAWYGPFLDMNQELDDIDEICAQGYADYFLNGVNKAEAKRARKV